MKQLGGTVARPAARWDTPRRASYAQERFWFLHQFDPGSSVLNLPAQFRLLGRLDAATLRRSLQEVVNRHEALRTTFAVVDGQLFQVLAPTLTVALPVVDLRHLPEFDSLRWVFLHSVQSRPILLCDIRLNHNRWYDSLQLQLELRRHQPHH